MEDVEEYIVRDGLCVSLEQLTEAFERAEAALTVEELSGGVRAWFSRGKGLASFQKCLRERKCLDGVLVLDGGARRVFVKSEFLEWELSCYSRLLRLGFECK